MSLFTLVVLRIHAPALCVINLGVVHVVPMIHVTQIAHPGASGWNCDRSLIVLSVVVVLVITEQQRVNLLLL